MKFIESKQNPLFKQWLKLNTRKARKQSKTFIVDGLRIVEHALESGLIETIVMSESYHQKVAFTFDVQVYVVPDQHFKLLIETENPQGILGIVKEPELPLKSGKILYLDGIQDPGNMGTLIRTADAAGFSGVVLRSGCTDPFNQKALRSSMGSILSIPLILNDDLSYLRNCNTKIYAAALENGVNYRHINYPDESVLIIGNEGNGISDEVLELADQRIYIPMIGAVESLNASIAGGILMFEMQKSCT
ncbi:MAG: RNA methyltransferase [Clostridia bacterium]|nr:RNA methyltransferase [Clostridia bacterium]